MPERVVIHPGFHKTGTTTIQAILRGNRPTLRPYLKSVLQGQIKDVLHAARGYSTWRDPLTREKFRRRFAALLDSQRDIANPCLCISAENLSGHLAGRREITDFSAAIDLAQDMAQAVAQAMPQAQLAFLYTTRDPKAWLRSAYWEHVKSSSLTLSFDDFAQRYDGAQDLDAIVDAVAQHTPDVHRARLEDIADAPARPLLDLCGVPRDVQDALPAFPRANTRLDDATLAALLQANRDYPDRDQRRAAKAAILADIRG